MQTREGPIGLSRRGALKAAAGSAIIGTALIGGGHLSRAQTMSDIEALNLMLNTTYLLAQFESKAVNVVVPIERLAGNGAAGVTPVGGRTVTFTDTVLREIVVEMAADNRNQLLPIRTVIGALSAQQPLMNIDSVATAPFSFAMQQAGVVAAGAAFDPYASEENLLYALFLLKNISTTALRGLASTLTNRVVVQNFTGILATESIHSATIRSYLYSRGTTTPRLRQNADKIAAFQATLNGGSAFQGVTPSDRSYAGGTAPVRVANISPAQPNGELAGRTAGQILNQLYLTRTVASAGGFFPQGVNGSLRTSAGA